MFKSLLVPLDESPGSAAALPLARAVARATQAKITLLRVVPDWQPGTPRPASIEASAYLDRIVPELVSAGLDVAAVVRGGEVAPTILAEAAAHGADLIVMATRGRAGLERAVLGSVSGQVLAETPVPLLLMRPGGHRVSAVRKLLVPVDGTPGGSLALGVAVGLAHAAAASITLLRVAVPLPLWVYEPTLGINTGPFLDPRWDEDARASAQAYVDALADRLRASGMDVEAQAVLGTVPGAIAQVAEESGVDVVVMSTHAHTGPVRAVLGSVADAVVRTSRHPVLLVRRRDPDRPVGERDIDVV